MMDGESDLPELTLATMLHVFIPGEFAGRVRITRAQPLVGELGHDVTGRFFLAPEQDDRGGGMHAIPVSGLSTEQQRRLVNRVVKLTGVFEDGRGVTVEEIAPVAETFGQESHGLP